jgi:hypothetical protein
MHGIHLVRDHPAQKERSMKVFGAAIAVAIALAVVGAIGLSFVQETVVQAYSTSGDRFNQLESVTF